MTGHALYPEQQDFHAAPRTQLEPQLTPGPHLRSLPLKHCPTSSARTAIATDARSVTRPIRIISGLRGDRPELERLSGRHPLAQAGAARVQLISAGNRHVVIWILRRLAESRTPLLAFLRNQRRFPMTSKDNTSPDSTTSIARRASPRWRSAIHLEKPRIAR